MLTSTAESGERQDLTLRLGVGDAGARARPGPLGALGRLEARHPEWWVLLIAAGAWIWMAAMPHAGAAQAGPAAHGAHGAHHGHAAPVGLGIVAMAVMVIAMMLPLTVGGVRRVAGAAAWERRHRSVAGFITGYLGVWMGIMIAIATAWALASSVAGWKSAAVAVAAMAVLWEVAPAAWRQMRPGSRPKAAVADGWRADAACARVGAEAGVRCGTSCWALMAACVAFGHSLPVVAVLFGVQLGARYPQRPARVLAALVVLGVCLGAIAARGTARAG